MIGRVLAFYADRYGIGQPEFAVSVGVDTGPGVGAYVSGDTIYIGRGFVDGEGLGTAFAHEYFHILQKHWQGLAPGGSDPSPFWLIEGAATYVGDVWEQQNAIRTRERIRAEWIWESAAVSDPLGDMNGYAAFLKWGFPLYHLAALATELLVEEAGEGSLAEYWRLLAGSPTWQGAFEAAFGLPVDEFYAAFDDYYQREVVAAFRWMRGVVLGPDGEPLAGIELWAHPVSDGRSRFGRTAADGEFGLAVPGGAYILGVYRRPTGAWETIGWYGEDGFTTTRDLAAAIDTGGADVAGIEVRLPSPLAELPTLE